MMGAIAVHTLFIYQRFLTLCVLIGMDGAWAMRQVWQLQEVRNAPLQRCVATLRRNVAELP